MNSQNNIDYLLLQTAALLSRQIDQVMQERVGIGLSQYRILEALAGQPRITQRQMSVQLNQTEASVSRQVKILTQMELLMTRKNPDNKREKLHVLTPKAIRMAEAARQAAESYTQPIFASLPEKDQKNLLRSLDQLHSLLTLRA